MAKLLTVDDNNMNRDILSRRFRKILGMSEARPWVRVPREACAWLKCWPWVMSISVQEF